MPSIPLRHGVFLAPYHHLEDSPTTLMQRDLELAQHLDRMGFDEMWVGEHHSGGFETICAPDIFVTAAAMLTKRLRFGTGVMTLPYYNPLIVANRMAQIDHMTRGRVSFGFGPGLLMQDALMMGVEPSKTRDMMLQSIDCIVRLLRGETVTEKTDWYTLNNARAHLLPFSQPLEMAVASAGTPSGGTAAGKYGMAMLCVAATTKGGYDVLASNWKIANDVAAIHGHSMNPAQLRLVVPMHIADTREKARANVRHGVEKWAAYYNLSSPNPFEGTGDVVDKLIDSKRAVIGTPEDAIEMIERLRGKQGQFGVILTQHVDWADWDETFKSYELYARHVMPHFTNVNVNRHSTLAVMQDQFAAHATLRQQSSEQAFAKHERSVAAGQTP